MFDFLDIFDQYNLYERSGMFDIDRYDRFYNPLPDQAKYLGYDGSNMILMLKTLAFFQLFYIIKLIFAFLIYFWTKFGPQNDKAKILLKKITKNMFFKEILSL